jgi:hypothetical protein
VHFGPRRFYWQQDNAPAQGPGREVIAERFQTIPRLPQSPDFCPIEMVSSIIKRRFKGRRFQNQTELFAAIEERKKPGTKWTKISSII